MMTMGGGKSKLIKGITIQPILETAHRKAVCLGIQIAVHRRVAGIEVAVPRGRATRGRRPEVGVRREIVERAIGIAVAGWRLG